MTRLIPAGAGPWVSLAVFFLIGITLLVMYRNRSLVREPNA